MNLLEICVITFIVWCDKEATCDQEHHSENRRRRHRHHNADNELKLQSHNWEDVSESKMNGLSLHYPPSSMEDTNLNDLFRSDTDLSTERRDRAKNTHHRHHGDPNKKHKSKDVVSLEKISLHLKPPSHQKKSGKSKNKHKSKKEDNLEGNVLDWGKEDKKDSEFMSFSKSIEGRPSIRISKQKTFIAVDNAKSKHKNHNKVAPSLHINIHKIPLISNVNEKHKKRKKSSIKITTTNDTWPKVRKDKMLRKKVCKPGERCREESGMAPVTMMQQEQEKTTESTTTEKSQQSTGGSGELPAKLTPYNIRSYISQLEEKFPDANISSEVVGKTASYNDIVLLKMMHSNNSTSFRADEGRYADDAPEKKIVFIVHGLSVMGWYFIPCLYKTDEFLILLKYYTAQLDKFDIYLIPMANPDGVAAQAAQVELVAEPPHIPQAPELVPDRVGSMWNKNTSPQESCSGVYLDRNFDVAWQGNHSIDPCSQQYPGKSPITEHETKAVKEILHRNSHRIVAYMHVHSGTYDVITFKGDAVLYPRGYSDSQSDDDRYIDMKGEIDESMRNASFQIVNVAMETLHNWYGLVRGASVDYASTIYGVPYALELCMQPYKDDLLNTKPELAESYVALTELWRRAIESIFVSINRYGTSSDANNNRRRFLN